MTLFFAHNLQLQKIIVIKIIQNQKSEKHKGCATRLFVTPTLKIKDLRSP